MSTPAMIEHMIANTEIGLISIAEQLTLFVDNAEHFAKNGNIERAHEFLEFAHEKLNRWDALLASLKGFIRELENEKRANKKEEEEEELARKITILKAAYQNHFETILITSLVSRIQTLEASYPKPDSDDSTRQSI